jgi:hypothetical protein
MVTPVLKIKHQFIHEFPDRSTLFQRRKARLILLLQYCKKAEMFWRAHLQGCYELRECLYLNRAVERADGLETRSKNPRFALKS